MVYVSAFINWLIGIILIFLTIWMVSNNLNIIPIVWTALCGGAGISVGLATFMIGNGK